MRYLNETDFEQANVFGKRGGGDRRTGVQHGLFG